MKKSVILVGLLLMGLQMFGQYKIEWTDQESWRAYFIACTGCYRPI